MCNNSNIHNTFSIILLGLDFVLETHYIHIVLHFYADCQIQGPCTVVTLKYKMFLSAASLNQT